MPAYIVTLPDEAVGQRKTDTVVVFAADAQDAKDICKARYAEDGDAGWEASTPVEVADVPMDTSPNMAGYKLHVAILNASPLIEITVENTGANDTIDELAALAVIALNADAQIANAAYADPVLTISSIADGLGDLTTLIELIPPAATFPGQKPIAGLIASKVHEGIAGAVLTVTFQVGSYAAPAVYGEFNAGKS